jgi:hypothetical protein
VNNECRRRRRPSEVLLTKEGKDNPNSLEWQEVNERLTRAERGTSSARSSHDLSLAKVQLIRVNS